MFGAKKLLIAIGIGIIGIFSIAVVPQDVFAQALRVLTPPQGGTGIGSATAGQIGTCLKVLDDSPFTYELGTCGSGGSGSGGTDTLFNWNTATNIISTDGASTTATTSLTTNGFTANFATITSATSTTGWFSSFLGALNALFTNATSTALGTSEFRAMTSAGISIHSNSGSEIADFGAGGGTNATFNGGVNITGALGVTGASTFSTFNATHGTTTYLGINGETFSDLTGTGLQNVGNVLTLNATGDWTGTFDGQQGTYYLDRTNHTGTQLASTISDFSSTARGLIFDTVPGLTYTSGTGVLSLDSGSVIPTTSRAIDWDTAFGWGNHAVQGYITDGNTNWDNSYGFVTEGQTVGTSTAGVQGQASYWTGIRTLGTVATGSLSENVSGLEFDNSTRGLFGGSATLSLTSGFRLPSTTAMSSLETFTATPSTVITAGTGIDWSGNTLNGVYTAGDGLTLTVEDFDCDTASGSVFGCLLAGDWNTFNQKVSSTSIDTSSELRSLVTDETGTGALMFGITSTMSDDVTCGASQVLARNSGDTAWECVAMSSGGSGGGGIATTTDTNNEVGETISYLTTDFYVGGSASTTAEFNFDKDTTRFTMSSTTANATGTITSTSGGIKLGSATENVELNVNLADTLRLFSSTGISAFDFGDLRASSTFASTTALTIFGSLYDGNSSAGTNGMVLQSTGSGIQWVATSSLGITGGSGSSVVYLASSSPWTRGDLAYVASDGAVSSVATGTLTTNATGLEFSATRGVVGGSSVLSLTSGYVVPTTTRMSLLDTFYTTPSTRITDGNGLTWSGNTLNFDGGNTPAGDLGGTWASPSVTDDSHNHTGATLSGIDISDDTNLSADGTEIILTGDALSLGTALTFTSATSTNFFTTVASTSNFFGAGLYNCTGSGNKLTWSSGQFTCETDQTGGGGGSSNWVFQNGALRPSTTVGIVASASSTIGGGTNTTGLTITGGATTTGTHVFGSSVTINSELFSDLTGFGLANSAGSLGIDTTGAANGECLKYNSTGPAINWDTCGGGGSSKWTDGTTPYTYLTNTTYDLAIGSSATETAPFWWDVSATTSYIGNGGAGDSVITLGPTGQEYTMGFDDTDDYWKVSTSTSLGSTDLFRLFATTTVASASSTKSGSTYVSLESARGVLGKFQSRNGAYLMPNEVLNLNGTINTGEWVENNCTINSQSLTAAVITADALDACGDWMFQVDSGGSMVGSAYAGAPAITLGRTVTTANTGAGIFLHPGTTNFRIASTTPIYEAVANISNFGTSTYNFLGLTSIQPNGTTFEARPEGCFFYTASTTANWQAYCGRGDFIDRTTGGFDTGISTSTSQTNGEDQMRRFKIVMGAENTYFYIGTRAGGDRLVGTVNKPSFASTSFYPGAIIAGASTENATQASSLFVRYIKFKWAVPL